MRKHLWQNDGRLKTGRISLIFFLGLMLGLGLLFNLQKPVDKAIVVVKHVFAANPKAPSAAPVESLKKSKKPVAKPQDKVVKTEKKVVKTEKKDQKPKETMPKPAPAPVKMAQVDPVKNEVSVSEPPKKIVKLKKIKPEPEPKVVAEKPVAKPVRLPAAVPIETSKKSPVRPEKELAQDHKVVEQPPAETKTVAQTMNTQLPKEPAAVKQHKTAPEGDILPEELVIAPPPVQSPELPTAERSGAVTLLTEAQRRVLSTRPPVTEPAKKTVKTAKFAPIKPLKVKKTASVKSVKTAKNGYFRAVPGKFKAKPQPVKNGDTSGITVAGKEYKKLLHAWQIAGKNKKEDDHVIPLQIENLRAAYDLLQMKAVVIRADGSCIDLTDGSRIPKASLDRFSTTVLRVKDPWQKWGPQLKTAGLRPGQTFKVRYYLYDFVSRSIYARVNQAYRWSLARGLIQAETRPDEVDVLGRTFVIKRDNGGAFGVFVPLSLKTGDGRRVTIDPVCFSNAPDINALHSAGLI